MVASVPGRCCATMARMRSRVRVSCSAEIKRRSPWAIACDGTMLSLLAVVPLIATVSYVTSVPPTIVAAFMVRYCSPASWVRKASRILASS